MTERKNNIYICIPLICGIIVVVLNAIKTTYDNDIWWLLATGKEIVQNGFPVENPWSIHEGLKIVIQQWIPSVVLFLVYDYFGMVGVEAFLILLISALFVVIYKLCLICNDRKCGAEVILLLLLIASIPLSVYFSCRPQIYSMIAYSAVIIVLEKYRRNNNHKSLLWLPLITLIHVNLHASMVMFDLFIIFLYLIPDIPSLIRKKKEYFRPTFCKAQYHRKPLLLSLAAATLVLVVNPYGMKGALYLVESYGAASYSNYISEMQPPALWSVYGIADLFLIIIGSIIVGHNGIENINFPLTVLFLSSAVLSVQHVRNIWLLSLFAIPLIMNGIENIRINFELPRVINKKVALAIEAVVLLDIMFLYGFNNIWPTFVKYIEIGKGDAVMLPRKSADYMAEYAEEKGLERNQINVFCTFDNGGFFEYYGFKVNMDARPELWEPAITGNENHYYQEYVDFDAGNTSVEEYLTKYNFDYYVVCSGTVLEDYMNENPSVYEIAEECNDYNLWRNIERTEEYHRTEEVS